MSFIIAEKINIKYFTQQVHFKVCILQKGALFPKLRLSVLIKAFNPEKKHQSKNYISLRGENVFYSVSRIRCSLERHIFGYLCVMRVQLRALLSSPLASGGHIIKRHFNSEYHRQIPICEF